MLEPQEQDFEVIHQNWQYWKFFQKISSQWRLQPMGGIIGLDYTALGVVLNFYPKKNHKKIFKNIRWIEQGALKAFKENNG